MSKHAATRLRNIYRKHTLLAICLLLALFLVVSIGVKGYINRPRDLGPRLEYVGKASYGCWWLVCDSTPGNTYYFATDMTPGELTRYFKKARCDLPDNVAYELDCISLNGKESFGGTYFDKRTMSGSYDYDEYSEYLNKSGKQLILRIDKKYYAAAKASL